MKRNLLIALACLPVLLSCGSQPSVAPANNDYKTTKVSRKTVNLNSNFSAAITGRQSVDIRPQISGVITDIRFSEGAEVKKGQILFIIDQAPYKSALAIARANVKSAKAALATAELKAESKKELFDAKVVSDYDLQTTLNELAAAEASLAQAVASKDKALTDLSYTEIKSPVNGVTSLINYRVGALVSSSITNPLVSVTDNSEMFAYFSMSEPEMLNLVEEYGSREAAIKEMPTLALIMSNGSEYAEKGRVDAISGTINSSTGTVSMRAVFTNPSSILTDGANGRIELPRVLENSIVIPKAATFELQNLIFAYKVVNGKAESVELKVYPMNNGKEYIVESGLTEGDLIISEGAGLVREGAVVNVK